MLFTSENTIQLVPYCIPQRDMTRNSTIRPWMTSPNISVSLPREAKGRKGWNPGRIKNRGPNPFSKISALPNSQIFRSTRHYSEAFVLIPEDVFRECILGSALHDHISCWALYERAVSTADAETLQLNTEGYSSYWCLLGN